MKYRALRRLKHKLEILNEQLRGVEVFHFAVFNYNMEDKLISPEKLLLRAIKQIEDSFKRGHTQQ